ncbi:MAG TPA: hypothetical protein VLA01_00095 [Nitrosopumilaceae archaeon]|nr:hypothetical protein [Nitrosopumilaceae archaeon]
MEKKHINRKKTYTPDGITDFEINSKTDDDEWSRFQPSIGEKIISEEIFEVPNRAITFDRKKFVKNKEQEFYDKSEEFKDDFINTAQYLKFINAHLAEKKNHLDKVVTDNEQFSDDVATLNPKLLTKEQLDKKNYTQLKSDDVRKVLANIVEERDLLKEKIDYFTSQMSLAKKELVNKNNQVDKIKSELSQEVKEELVEPKISEDKSVSDIQQELKSIASKNESEKIFGAINSLVVLLNSKNQATHNELNAVKSEFNKMKQEYNKVMNDLQKKKK